jgi:hypothetical protein
VVSHVFSAKQESRLIELIVLLREPGVFKGVVMYDENPIANGTFDILCLTRDENAEMLEIVNTNSGRTSHKASIIAVGDTLQSKVRKAFIYVSPKLFYVQEYIFSVIPIRIAVYRISPMTKVIINVSALNR